MNSTLPALICFTRPLSLNIIHVKGANRRKKIKDRRDGDMSSFKRMLDKMLEDQRRLQEQMNKALGPSVALQEAMKKAIQSQASILD
jgi:hypothetical protein